MNSVGVENGTATLASNGTAGSGGDAGDGGSGASGDAGDARGGGNGGASGGGSGREANNNGRSGGGGSQEGNGDGTDHGQIQVTGVLTNEGVECRALRARNGQLYTLAGDADRFEAGDTVRVTGTRAQMYFCQQGTTINVHSIQRAP